MTSSKPADLPGGARNPGTDFKPDWVNAVDLDGDRTYTRAAEPGHEPGRGSRSVDEVLTAIGLLDLTTLSDDDTESRVRTLCAQAIDPLGHELSARLRPEVAPRVAAVCVFDRFARVAAKELSGTGVAVAAVTAGFPRPHQDTTRRLAEIEAAVEAGAAEIDALITRELALDGQWERLHAEVRALRRACGAARLKVILAAGDLDGPDVVTQTGLVCCMGGADFIKTSTGREHVNATLPIGRAMAHSIRRYAERTGYAVGLKAAGGIRSADTAFAWLRLVTGALGPEWVTPDRFRIGASSLLGELVLAVGREARPPGLGPAEDEPPYQI